jgi:hypothetical protein
MKPAIKLDPRSVRPDTAQHTFATPAVTTTNEQAVYGEDLEARRQQIREGLFDPNAVTLSGQPMPSLSTIAGDLRRKELESYGRDPNTGQLIDPSTGVGYAAATRDELGNVSDPYFQKSKSVYERYYKQLNDEYMTRQQQMSTPPATIEQKLRSKMRERQNGTN